MTILDNLGSQYPDLAADLSRIDAATVFSALQAIADVPAPSQLSAALRGPAVRSLLRQWDPDLADRLEVNLFGSGAVTLSSGSNPHVRLVAHLDEISYLLRSAEQTSAGWPLTAYCYHLADRPQPARVIRYDVDGGTAVVATGHIQGQEGDIHFCPDDPSVRLVPGDRITLYSAAQRVGDHDVTGSLDNAAGVVTVLLAARVLHEAGISYSVVLPDEEEGPAGQSSQTISRGAARALGRVEPATLTIVVDIHGLPPSHDPTTDGDERWGASFPESSSSARGSVTPPPIYRWLTGLVPQMQTWGIRVRPNVGGYVPRSDDVVAMLHSNAVAILGYPGVNRHFDHGLPTANLEDLADLSKALAFIGAALDVSRDDAGGPPW